MRTHHITVPGGFAAAGVACGVKHSGTEDVAIFCADRAVPAAVLTTSNQVVGAPVQWCRSVLPRGRGKVRAFVVNSGCSNVCTGKRGLRDAETMARLTADAVAASGGPAVAPQQVLVASTGVIGQPLPMDRIRAGIADAAGRLSRRGDAAALRAIMTTDTREKSAVVQARLAGRDVTVAGIAKGAGMIAPSLATMIALVTTDAAVTPAALHRALRDAARRSFNALTIDSDQSTSDTVVAMASGAAGGKPMTTRSPGYRKFAAAVAEVCDALARAMAADGEGATRLVEVRVRRAASAADAEIAAKSVANSPLVKTAVHGCDPNWGRIVMALGKSAARIDPEALRVRIGDALVFSRGRGRGFDEAAVRAALGADEVVIDCDLGLGKAAFTALGCDLSREYVAVNADYHT
ncbi:MAG: bifunctional glutamate N-acetyltransferase/amino-acid acetyltransferase ArgJ [Phycisphaerae bacterium]|nr:bifunctional glutamate N-acetyltransferase/amino-acid acetyltransferase ArgJ [Phycisphaerae bacterium]